MRVAVRWSLAVLGLAMAEVAQAQIAPAPLPSGVANDPGQGRIVAYIYETIPITREELGEYLIARFGTERLDLLVNKRIIEIECRKAGIDITQAEIDEKLNGDLSSLNVDRKTFVDQVLGKYKKSLYEWREDVLRPQILLAKLVKSRVKVTEDDLKKAHDAYYGEKIECRLIMWQKGEEKAAMAAYGRIRDSEEEFVRAARGQKSPSLASAAGRIRPIGRNTTGNDELEKAAFSMQPGEISALVGTPEGIVCIKCDKRLPADTTVSIDSVREKLTKEVFEKKINAEIPVVFAEMRKRANPRLLMGGKTAEDIGQQVRQLLDETPGEVKPIKPASNNVVVPAGATSPAP